MKKIHILLVDDDQDDHDFFEEVVIEMELPTFTMSHVYNGLEALDYLENAVAKSDPLPSLIVLDINMPKLDGIGTLAKISQHHKLKAIPVYILTTTGSEIQKLKCREYGCIGFYTKPAHMNELKTIAQQMLDPILES